MASMSPRNLNFKLELCWERNFFFFIIIIYNIIFKLVCSYNVTYYKMCEFDVMDFDFHFDELRNWKGIDGLEDSFNTLIHP
jgi:hypothetical protein